MTKTNPPAPDRSVNIGGPNSGGQFVTGDNSNITNNTFNSTTNNSYVQVRARNDPERAKLLENNPYKGMNAFQEADADRFFGRDKLIGELLERFQALTPLAEGGYRILPILGPSGSGKSSVARAGLLPRLRKAAPGALAAAFVPTAQPIHALALALARLAMPGDNAPRAKTAEFEALLRGPGGAAELDGIVKDLADSHGMVLLVDQFEEVFSLCKEADETKAFIQLLLDATSDPLGTLSVILTMRTDFLGETQPHNALNQVVMRTGEGVPTMSQDEITQAITRPALDAGALDLFDPTTVDRLVADTLERQGALPLLQYMLDQIWQEMATQGQTAAETYSQLEGLGGAIASRANTIYRALSTDAERAIARRAFLAMVTFNADQQPTRGRAKLSEMMAAGDDPEALRAILRRFADERLVAVWADPDGELRAEVAHEALFTHWDKLKGWIEEGRDDLRFRASVIAAAKHWVDLKRQGGLWRPPDLDMLEKYATRAGQTLSQLEAEFLAASQAAIEQEARQARLQKSNLLAATAFQALRDDDAPLALLLGLEALSDEDADSPDFHYAETALRAAVFAQAEMYRWEDDDFECAALSADGKVAVVGGGAVVTFSFDPTNGKALRRYPDKHLAQSLLLDVDGSRLLTTYWGPHPPRLYPKTDDGIDLDHGAEVRVTAAAFSRTGARVATGGDDSVVRIWDADDGRLIASMDHKAGRIRDVDWSADGSEILAIANDDEAARIWKAETGAEIARLEHESQPKSADYSPGGTRIVTIGWGNDAFVWDAESRQQLFRLEGHDAPIEGAVFSPDGKSILTWSDDGTARVWTEEEPVGEEDHDGADRPADPPPRMVAKTLEGHEGPVTCGSFAADGRIVTASEDFTARVWAPYGRCLCVLRGHQAELIFAGCPSGNRDAVMTASQDGTVRFWNIRKGAQVMNYLPPDELFSKIHAGALSPDGDRVLGVSGEGAIVIWGTVSGELVGVYESKHPFEPDTAAISRDGRRVAVAADDLVLVIDLQDMSVKRLDDAPRVQHVSFSPDGEHLALSPWVGPAQLWDLASGKLQHAWDFGGAVAFFPDGDDRVFLASSVGGMIVREDQEEPLYLAPAFAQTRGAVSADGRSLVTTTNGVHAYLWDTETGRLRYTLKGHKGIVNDAAFSPDGALIATASEDHTIRLWDARLGLCLATFQRHLEPIQRVSFSTDGEAILSVAGPVLDLWFVEAGRGHELRERADLLLSREFTPEERHRFGVAAPKPDAEEAAGEVDPP